MDDRIIEMSVDPVMVRNSGGGHQSVRIVRFRVDGWTYSCPVTDQTRIDDMLINAGHTLKRYLARIDEEKNHG